MEDEKFETGQSGEGGLAAAFWIGDEDGSSSSVATQD
jgi:hypothetical protein